jgi:O-acetyl-ADP-ribose deacetylase (regulator of RNase III)
MTKQELDRLELLETTGDLFRLLDDGKIDVLVHGVNCQGQMGAGLARQVAIRYPGVKTQYLKHCGTTSPHRLPGTAQTVQLPTGGIVANLFTQVEPGPFAETHLIYRAFLHLFSLLPTDRVLTIGIPLIGCGIGGLDWKDVKPVVKDAFSQTKYYWPLIVRLP